MQVNKEIKFHEAIYFLLLGFIFLYPFLIYPVNDIYYSAFYKYNYLVIFILSMWTFMIVHWLKNKERHIAIKTTGEKLVILYLFIVLLSTIFSVDPLTSFLGNFNRYIGFLLWFCYISLFLFSYHFIPVIKHVNYIRMLTYSSFLVGVYGIFQHFFIELLVPSAGNRSFVKSWGFFDNPNHFGTYIVIFLLLSMTLLLIGSNKKEWLIQLAISGTLFLSLLYTMTRGAWLAVFVGTVILTILVVIKRKHLWARWGVLLLSFAVLFIFVDISEDNYANKRVASFGNDVNTLVLQEDNVKQVGSGRWEIWMDTLPLVKEYYLIGSGPNTFRQVQPNKELTFRFDSSFNDFLEIAYSMGIPALLVYLAFLYTIVKSAYVSAKKLDEKNKILSYGFVALIISYLVKVMFNVSVLTVGPFFWVVLGMSYALSMSVPVTSRNLSNE